MDDKETEFDAAAFGIVGLETALGLILTHLVHKKIISIAQMVEHMAYNPRRILQLPENRIHEGEKANLTVLDPEMEWQVDKTNFLSKSVNTPFERWSLKGGAWAVINNHQMMFCVEREELRGG
jgi:dihydroorotase